jgi:hypothetical protein
MMVCRADGYRLPPPRPATNRDTLRRVVKAGPPPGLLAIRGELAVGWCRVTPREAVPGLDRPFRTRRVDDVAAWSISCFSIRKGHPGRWSQGH